MEDKMLPELQEIAEYLREMRFKKKAVGGCDQDDVLMHMEKVTNMYDQIVAGLQRKAFEQEKQLVKIQTNVNEPIQVQEVLEEPVAVEKIQAANVNPNETFEKVLEQLDNAKAEVIRKAQTEAGAILKEARMRASEEEQKIEQLRQQRIALEKEYKLKVFETKDAIRKTKSAIGRYHKDFQEMLDTLSVADVAEDELFDNRIEKIRERRI